MSRKISFIYSSLLFNIPIVLDIHRKKERKREREREREKTRIRDTFLNILACDFFYEHQIIVLNRHAKN